MNMYLHELKVYRKSTIIWILSLVGLLITFMAMFPAISSDAIQFSKMLESYPEELKKAFGISSLDLASVLGYYSFTVSYIVLCGAIQAMNLGTSVISVEVREKTADFLLAKPVTRQQVITSKLLAVLTYIMITNIIYFVSTYVVLEAVKSEPYSMKIFFMINFTLLFVQLIFFAIGIIIASVAKKIRSVLSVSLSIVFGFYIISLLGAIIGGDTIRYITPFRYFDTAYILENGTYETPFIIISIIFVVGSVIGSFLVYSKRDIPAI